MESRLQMAMTLSSAMIVKSLAAKFGFREEEALAHLAREFLVATPLTIASGDRDRGGVTWRGDVTARSESGSLTSRSERGDFLERLAPVEAKEAAKAKAKVPKLSKEDAAAAKKEAKEAKEAAKAAKPKQAMTGKRLWAAAGMRTAVTEALKADLAEGEKVGIGDVNKELTAQWKALTESERADWDAKAAAGEVPSSGDDSE